MPGWKDELADFFNKTEQESATNPGAALEHSAKASNKTTRQVARFYKNVVDPAFEELREELLKYGREVRVAVREDYGYIAVFYSYKLELEYAVKVKVRHQTAVPSPYFKLFSPEHVTTYTASGHFRAGVIDYTVTDISKDEIINDFIWTYVNHVTLDAT